jgi:HlyD family type I secretion membrane fusion protein
VPERRERPVPEAPRPVPARWPVAVGSALLAALALWAALTRVEVVIAAPVTAELAGGNAQLRSPDARRVIEVRVTEGAEVQAGELLLRLDVAGAEARWRTLRDNVHRRQRDRDRVRAVLVALDGGPEPGEDADAMRLLGEHRARLDALAAEAAALEVELLELDARMGTLERLRQISSERLRAATVAEQRGAISRFELLRVQQDHEHQTVQLDAAIAQRRSLRHRLRAQRHTVQATELNRLEALADQLRGLDRETGELAAGLAEADERRGLGMVRSPVDGVVDALYVAAGDLVERGELLGVVVPVGPPITFEARVPPALMALVRPGQRCRIKLDAAPFARYGTLPCTVARVPRATADVARAPAHYPVRVVPDAAELMVDGRPFALQPGASGWVDLVVGQRSVMSYLTEPLRRFAAESLREP